MQFKQTHNRVETIQLIKEQPIYSNNEVLETFAELDQNRSNPSL